MAQRKSFKSAIDKTNLNEKRGIKSLVSTPPSEKDAQPPQVVKQEEEVPKDLRQTFVIREDYLEKLKDYVHMIRVTEDSYYTQKDAMHEALDMLFESAGEIKPRPDKLKEREQERAQRIRRGRAG
ncbi:hypothetical protein [Nafulsella turpanensis]|uniref:hypothetical protein n=1 Tax=Nafulsella turpanensis TaxID=1265690 RepID=UPI000345719E|nr:hypothetical protein [Nafulsella turpanensis]